jgi:hypothetical protein
MKRLFTIAVLALLTQFANAHGGGTSILNIRLNENSPFRLYIDGCENGPISRMAQVINLRPGNHYIQVYRIGRGWGYYGYNEVFNGSIFLTPNTESFVTVMPECNKLKFDRIVALNDNPWENEQRDPCFYPKAPVVGPGTCGTPPVPVVTYGPMAMNQSDFIQLKQTINNAGFESTRLTILKQALAYNNFTTQQVRELMDLFWFESSKLEVAKMLYPKTIDQQNYYLVNNNFAFSSSISQLNDYLALR